MKKLLSLLLLIIAPLLIFGQSSFTNVGGTWTYNQNFNSLTTAGAWSNNSTLSGWYIEKNSAGAISSFALNTGSTTTAGLYSYGTASASDRSIGSYLTNAFAGSPGGVGYGLRIQNNTGGPINSITVAYTGEQWRKENSATAHKLTFAYKTGTNLTTVGATDLITGGFTAITSLDFTTPQASATTATALDGNLAANRVVISATTITFASPVASNEEILLKWFDVNDSGNDHTLTIDDLTITAGQSTSPSLSATPVSISGLNYTENNGPSAATSYNLSGTNLTPLDDNITITAPTNFEVSTTANGTFTDNLLVPYTGGALATTPIFVRLKAGLTTGSYGGVSTFVTNTGGGASSAANVAVTGTVNAPIGSFTPIGTARTLAQGTSVNIAGRVTVAQQFGGLQIFIQDITGGISVFKSTGNMVQENSLVIGDSVQVTGTLAAFNQLLQVNVTQINKVAATSFIPEPKVITSTQILDNEGQLVRINDVNIPSATFAAQTNYTFTPVQVRITQQTNTAGYTNPLVGTSVVAGTGYVIGIAGRFNTSAQLLARLTTDIVRTGDPAPGSTDADFDSESTLDVACWNIEWFGATGSGFGPTDEALQLQNAKTVIKTINADIYNVNEIANLTAFNTLVTELNNEGFAYSGICSSRLSNNDNVAGQRVCFLYKTALFSNVTTKHIFETLDDALDAASVPAVLNSFPDADKTRFWASGRLPFTLTADVNIPNTPSKRIMFIGVHGRANTGTTPAEALSRYNMRKFDVEALKDTLDAQFPTLPIVMMGDFNDDIDFTVATTAGVPNNQTSYIAYNNDPTKYNMNTRSLSDAGLKSTVGFSDMIDHIISSNELTTEYIANSARVSNAESYITSYGSTTSDHYPVMLRFNLAVNPCVTVLNLVSPADDYTSGTQIKQASSTNGKITATNAVTGTANATYQAKSVELNAGFKADSGTIFRAEIGGCN